VFNVTTTDLPSLVRLLLSSDLTTKHLELSSSRTIDQELMSPQMLWQMSLTAIARQARAGCQSAPATVQQASLLLHSTIQTQHTPENTARYNSKLHNNWAAPQSAFHCIN